MLSILSLISIIYEYGLHGPFAQELEWRENIFQHPELDEYKVTILGLRWCCMLPFNFNTWLLPVRFRFNVNVQPAAGKYIAF